MLITRTFPFTKDTGNKQKNATNQSRNIRKFILIF